MGNKPPGDIAAQQANEPDGGGAAQQTEVPGSITYLVDTRDKPGLLTAMAHALAGDAFISFEGDLSRCDLQRLSGASGQETDVLKRNTLAPVQDFAVLPLEADTVTPILAQVSPSGRLDRQIIHVQISKHGRLAFGAYDNFHPECTVVFDAALLPVLDSLRAEGVIRSYAAYSPRY